MYYGKREFANRADLSERSRLVSGFVSSKSQHTAVAGSFDGRNYLTLEHVRSKLLLVFVPVCLMLAVRVADVLASGWIADHFGVVPRDARGILGIFLSWLPHANWTHFASNMPAFIGLSFALLSYGNKTYLFASAFIAIISGAVVWAFARVASHVGCSGLIFGYFGFCCASLIYERPIMLRSVFVARMSLHHCMFMFQFFSLVVFWWLEVSFWLGRV